MSSFNEIVKEKHRQKLEWLEKLAKFNPKHELRVATTYDGEHIGQWIPFADWPDVSYIDHVTVLPNECIWENDHDNWEFVRKYSEKIIEALDRFEVPHVQGPTSGRGFHIHAYFLLPDMSVRKKLNDYGILPRDLRLSLFNLIYHEAKIPITMIGKGLPFDTGCIDFSDLSMGHMVRVFGGRKFENGSVIGHKSFVNEIPKEKIRILRFMDVQFPEKIVPYSIPKKIIEDLLVLIEKKKQNALKHRELVSDGLYLNAPCVKSLIADGRPKGDRNRGAQTIAIACRMSGLCYEAAKEVGQEYHSNCENGDFHISEVEGWLRWAYSRDPDWRCSQLIPFRRCQPQLCPVNESQMKRKRQRNPEWLRKYQTEPTISWNERKRQEG